MKKLIVILSFILISCGSRKTHVKEFVHVTDTLIQTIDRTIEVPVVTETVISEPCDSNGILKSFETSINTNKGVVKLFSDSNRLHAFIEVKPDTCTDELVYQTREVLKYKDKKIIEYKAPPWAWYSLCANILLISFLTRKLWL